MSRSRKKSPYRGSRAFDPSCRCHGGCPYCESGRLRYQQIGKDIEAASIADLDFDEGQEQGNEMHERDIDSLSREVMRGLAKR